MYMVRRAQSILQAMGHTLPRQLQAMLWRGPASSELPMELHEGVFHLLGLLSTVCVIHGAVAKEME